jgi:hypothetical protein
MTEKQPEADARPRTLGDDALQEWYDRRRLPTYGPRGENDKPGGLTRDQVRLVHVDYVNDDRGTRIPLAEEDETAEWYDGRAE